MFPWIWSGRVERTVPSTRRASGVVKTSSVGMFATCLMPFDSSSATRQSPSAWRPIERSSARAAIAELREAALVQRSRALLQPADVVAPGGNGIRLVEPHGLTDRLPEPFDVGLAEHRPRPALVGVRNDQSGAEPIGQLQRLLVERMHACLADPRAVEVGEQFGLRVPGDRAERAADVTQFAEPRHEPRRRVAEHRVIGQFDVRAPDVLVGVEHVDVPGARGVGLARDCAGERRMFDERVDPENLVGLEVQTDLNGKAGIALEALIGSRHGGEL